MFTGFLLSRSPRNMPEGGPRSDRRTNSPVPAVFDVTVRMAAPTDRVALERLAALDSARVPAGALLVVAAVAGTIQAAQPVSGDRRDRQPVRAAPPIWSTCCEVRARQLRDAGVDAARAPR